VPGSIADVIAIGFTPHRLREVACVSNEANDDKEHHLNMGITPYRGRQATPGQDYFKTTRFRGFVSYLWRVATEHNIKVERIERVEGLWVGNSEPALSVWLQGKREHIIELADDLGAKYNQSAVLLFEPDAEAEGFIYHVKLLPGQERDVVMASLTEHGISVGRLTASGDLEIADPDGSLARQVVAFAQALNATLTYSRGHVILREKNVHYGRQA
jgi:hypothetical protein